MKHLRPIERVRLREADARPKLEVLSDRQRIEEGANVTSRQKSLELLYDYTKFHIGAYLTITGAYLTAAFANVSGTPLLPLNLYLMGFAVFATMVAGFAGGVIVSSITQTTAKSTAEFLGLDIGPWDVKFTRREAREWTYVEHTSFWLGLIAAALSFLPAAWWPIVGIHFLASGYR